METIGLRFFTVYGPWGRPDMALFKFTKAIRNGNTIDVYNHGKMRRDFTYIDDLIASIRLLVKKALDSTYDIFNLGSNRPIALNDFITTIEEVMHTKAQINYLPLQAGDVLETFADCNKFYDAFATIDITPLKKELALLLIGIAGIIRSNNGYIPYEYKYLLVLL